MILQPEKSKRGCGSRMARPACVEMEIFGDIPTSIVYLDMDLNQQDVPFQMETIS